MGFSGGRGPDPLVTWSRPDLREVVRVGFTPESFSPEHPS